MILVLAACLLSQSSLDLEAAWSYARERGSHALIIRRQGETILEKYASGAKETRRLLASGTKSFNGVLFAAAMDDGLMNWNSKVGDFLANWKDDSRRSQVTIQQLLSLQSGIASGRTGGMRGGWDEAVGAPMRAEPGTRFQYGATPFYIFGAALEAALKGPTYEAWMKQRLLDPLGIQVEWRMKTSDGKPQNAGGAFMTAHDWGVFGQFLLDGGRHNGRQLIARKHLDLLHQPSKANPFYGTSFWLGETDASSAVQGRSREPDARVPRDLYQAVGAGNQKLMIVPSLGLVVVRMGGLAGARGWSDGDFFGALLAKGRTSAQATAGLPGPHQ